jgi:uncharacterized membrane protein YbhN (UPF0104 family)
MTTRRALKFVVAAALVGALIYGVDWGQARQLATHLTWATLGVVAAAMLVELVLSAMKWSWSLRIHGLRFTLDYLFRVLCTGYFLNNFLPTAIGGDAYRVYRTLPAEGYRSRALSAVIVERGTGFGALLALGVLGAFAMASNPAARAYLFAVLGGGLAGVVVLFALWKGALGWLRKRISTLAVVDAVEHNLQWILRARAEWVWLATLSFAFQITSVLIVFWLFMRLGAAVSLEQCALIAAASGIAALLPLSINGLGLMEGSLVGMAVALGIDYDSAALVAVVRRLMMALVSTLCGIAYLFEPKATRTASA